MSACPDCCVDELKRIRHVEEAKRKASKRSAASRASAAPQQQAVEHQQQTQQPRQGPPSQPGQGSRRSFHHDEQQESRQVRQGSGSSFHDDGPAEPSSRRPSQRAAEPSRRRRSSSHQRQNSLASNQSSLLSQHHPPPPKRSSSVTPVSRSLVPLSAGSDVDTASLTEPSSDSSNEADGSKTRSPTIRRGHSQQPRPSSFHGGNVPSARDQGRKTMYVRKMMHTDRATGRTGRYTGRVDENFVPDGEGTLTHDDGSVWEGEWRDGRLVSSGPVARRQMSTGGGRQRARSGSRTRTPREPSRDRHGVAHGSRASSGRSRSHSRTVGVRERSTSRSSTAGRYHHPHTVQTYGQ